MSIVKNLIDTQDSVIHFSSSAQREMFAQMLAQTTRNKGVQAEALAIELLPVVAYYPKEDGKTAPDFLLEDGKTVQCKYMGGRLNGNGTPEEAVEADCSDYWLLVADGFKGIALVEKAEMVAKVAQIAKKEKTSYKLKINEKNLRANFSSYIRV